MKTITAVNLVKKAIRDGLSNDEIRNLPKFKRMEEKHGYIVNDTQINIFRSGHPDYIGE